MSGFAAWFCRLTAGDGHAPVSPFPWQDRLYARLVEGDIPEAIDLPTGLGKTSVIACWLLAHRDAVNPRLPRRLVYVVDRRAVVDQASGEVNRFVRAWPKVSGSGAPGLTVATLRGQHVDSGNWARAPEGLSVIVGTVDMIGSRLLFSGYGLSPRMRPVHAGLMGQDTLLVLDEAHLAPAFADLVGDIADDAELRGRAVPPVAGFRMMALSATLRSRRDGALVPEGTFELDTSDYADPTVAKRVSAEKRIERRVGAAPENLAEAALDLSRQGSRIAVFVDSRQAAQKVASLIAKRHGAADVLLFTGGRRVRERSKAEEELREAGFLAGSGPPASPKFLVATAAGEVGVDLDAEHGVLDLVAWERMIQRLGRVNRRGERPARVIVCDGGVTEARGASLDACRSLLDKIGNASPANIAAVAKAAPDLVGKASSPAPLRPPLVRAELDAWSLTGLSDHPGRAPVAPFLRGWIEDKMRLRLAWRRHLPVRPGHQDSGAEQTAFFEAAPIHLSEILEIEVGVVADWLKRRVRIRLEVRDGDPVRPDTAVALLLDRNWEVARTFTLGDIRSAFDGSRVRSDRFLGDLASGTLVLDARLGGLSERGLLDPGWNQDASAADDEDQTEWAEQVGFRVVRTQQAEAATDDDWVTRFRFPLDEGDMEESVSLVVLGRSGSTVETRGDARSRAVVAVHLDDHAAHVCRHVSALAASLGLPEDMRALLVHAARLHDTGKAASVWQRAMNAPAGGPWAKTRSGDGRVLGGYRHEFGSLLEAESDSELARLPSEDRDFVLHLIASHHGHARPFIAAHGGDRGPPSANETAAREAALRFARLQRLWGPWGLAWWEAIFRAADWRASAEEQNGGTYG